MKCCRCGTSAMVIRDQQYYCGRCALARDWEEIIAIAQEAAGAPPQGTAPPSPPPERAPASV
jgi:hypothetical protein